MTQQHAFPPGQVCDTNSESDARRRFHGQIGGCHILDCRILASKIAEGLNVTLSQLLETRSLQEVIVIRKDDRQIFRDKSGFERHLLSPAFPSKGIEFILNVVPPHGESGVFPPHQDGVKEYLFVAQGRLRAILGQKEVDLDTGDSLFFQANVPHQFVNLGDGPCEYFLVIDSYMAGRT